MHHKTLSICFAFLSFFAYAAVGAPVQLSRLTKRDFTTVQQAVNGIVHPPIGEGNTGTVHALQETYNGERAVIKIMRPLSGGGHFSPGPAEEARNAKHVGQLLGYGHDEATNTHYLVMKHMGVSAAESGHDKTTVNRLNKEAEVRYAKDHGVENKDINPANYVYHSHDGHPKAEVIDWARTKYLDPENHPKVAAPHRELVTAPPPSPAPSIHQVTHHPAPAPHIGHVTAPPAPAHAPRRKCPTCAIQ